MSDQIKFNSTCDGCVEVAVSVAAGAPTVTVVDTNGTLGTVTAGNTGTFNDYLWNGNSTTISIPDGNTVASGKITGTIKYTNCPTPTATPASTPAPTPTPTPSPTSAGGGALTGGTTCANRVSWPAYGVGNKYQVTWSAANTPQFFQSDSTSRTFYIDNGTNTMTRKGYALNCMMMSSANIIANQGVNGLATNPTFFSLEATSGSTFPLTLDVWIV